MLHWQFPDRCHWSKDLELELSISWIPVPWSPMLYSRANERLVEPYGVSPASNPLEPS